MSVRIIPVMVNDGLIAHRIFLTAKIEARLRENEIIFDSVHCGAFGRLKTPTDATRLCAKCFPGDRRTVKEWLDANRREKAIATADALFDLFGMKRSQR